MKEFERNEAEKTTWLHKVLRQNTEMKDKMFQIKMSESWLRLPERKREKYRN